MRSSASTGSIAQRAYRRFGEGHAGEERPMNALTILKQDHGNVETLFRRFEDQGERAHTTKRRTVDKIIEQLSVHATVEEQVFYPAVRDCGARPEELVLEALEEHHVVKWTLHELERMAPTAERFDAKVKVLIESVRLHIEEEEKGLFPKVREKLSG